jgi:CheY-like chemotaxis protein
MAKILLAEDEELIADVFQQILESEGHEFIYACNGEIALEVLEARTGIELIITDFQMPGCEGNFVAARAITKDIPTVLISGRSLRFPDLSTGADSSGFPEDPVDSGSITILSDERPLEILAKVKALLTLGQNL